MSVTVLLPVHNGGCFLSEAIDSILAQTCENFKLLVIDDGCTDNSLNIVQAFARQDTRVSFISHKQMGMARSLNKGLEIAQTEWVIRMDADDVMLPNRVERQLAFVEENPEIDVSGTLVYYIDKSGQIIGKNSSDLYSREDFFRYVKSNRLIGFHHPSAIMRRNAILSIGGYRGEYWPADDIDLWNRLAESGHLILVQHEYLLKYRIHSSSVSVTDVRQARLRTQWLESNMLRRRKGLNEISLPEFLSIRKSKPLLERLNSERKDVAKVLYKKCANYYSAKMIVRSIFFGAGAFILQPVFFLREISRKWIFFLLSRSDADGYRKKGRRKE